MHNSNRRSLDSMPRYLEPTSSRLPYSGWLPLGLGYPSDQAKAAPTAPSDKDSAIRQSLAEQGVVGE